MLEITVGKYLRKSIYSIEEILSEVGNFTKCFDGDDIKMGSLRYRIFSKSTKCVHCSTEGLYFAKERFPNVKGYHFNLYGKREDGSELMFTKDHIIAKSKGGSDDLSNLQTMCFDCNMAKKDN